MSYLFSFSVEKLDHIPLGKVCNWNFRQMHDSIKSPVWSAASSPNLSESILVRWTAVAGFAAPIRRPIGLGALARAAHPPNWILRHNPTSKHRGGPNLEASLNHEVWWSSSFMIRIFLCNMTYCAIYENPCTCSWCFTMIFMCNVANSDGTVSHCGLANSGRSCRHQFRPSAICL